MDKTLFIVVLILSGLLIGAFAASSSALPGPNEQPLVFVHSATWVRLPSPQSHGKVGVGVQLAQLHIGGDPVLKAEVRFGPFLLNQGQPGSYFMELDSQGFPAPLNFVITIPPTASQGPSAPPTVIHATQVSRFQRVRMTSPLDGQLFHHHHGDAINVQWEVSPGPAPVRLLVDNPDHGGFFVDTTLPAGTTSYAINMSKTLWLQGRMRIELVGPDERNVLQGPVTGDSYVGFISHSYAIVNVVND